MFSTYLNLSSFESPIKSKVALSKLVNIAPSCNILFKAIVLYQALILVTASTGKKTSYFFALRSKNVCNTHKWVSIPIKIIWFRSECFFSSSSISGTIIENFLNIFKFTFFIQWSLSFYLKGKDFLFMEQSSQKPFYYVM